MCINGEAINARDRIMHNGESISAWAMPTITIRDSKAYY